MALLAGVLWDPNTAVSKATTANLAMTAIDTTNLRLTFTVPASGKVLVRLAGVLHGAATYPQILLGVMEGATVKGRVAPAGYANGNLAATTFVKVEGLFLVTGLPAGTSQTWDAAYGVETAVASTGLKYGGPNNTTSDDAWGGFTYEVWSA